MRQTASVKDGPPQQTSRQAFADLVRRRGRFYFRMAARMLADPADAEDACQSAFMNVWRNRDRISEPAKMQAYLTTAVVHACRETIRRRQRSRTTAYESETGLPPNEATTTLDRMAHTESIHAALSELPEQTQAVVVLRLVQDMSGRETARALGCSQSEVSRRLHDGMDRLRMALKVQDMELSR